MNRFGTDASGLKVKMKDRPAAAASSKADGQMTSRRRTKLGRSEVEQGKCRVDGEVVMKHGKTGDGPQRIRGGQFPEETGPYRKTHRIVMNGTRQAPDGGI
jgi:hypothetical protein